MQKSKEFSIGLKNAARIMKSCGYTITKAKFCKSTMLNGEILTDDLEAGNDTSNRIWNYIRNLFR